jgi:hypothetical protein
MVQAKADIFDFWAKMPRDGKVHPDDQSVFDELAKNSGKGNDFNLKCIPGPFFGPLRMAPVVFLFLSRGLADHDVAEADLPDAQQRDARQRQGNAPLPSEEDYPSAWKWWVSRTRHFGDLNDLRDKIAFLNIGAYLSKTVENQTSLVALPSSQASVAWARTVLFPQAEAGERVVVCLRSAKLWGLATKQRYEGTVFAPAVTRGGYMIKQGDNGALREEIIAAVKAAV